MANPNFFFFINKQITVSLFLLFFRICISSSLSPDSQTLMKFKALSDFNNKLTTWNSATDPCTGWTGVSCINNRVSRLVLQNLDLHGFIEPLASLTQLRVLSLKQNYFSGEIPDLSDLTSLKLLFLSHNNFSGEFPASVTSLVRLYRLDISSNSFSGKIPEAVNGLIHLLTLRLENNSFSGSIAGLNLPNLQDFNVTGNRISGAIPTALSGFPESAFADNAGICGSPMQSCKDIVSDPTRPGSEGAIASPLVPATNSTTISSSPVTIPSITADPQSQTQTNNNDDNHHEHHHRGSKISPIALIAVVVGDVIVLTVISLLLYCYYISKIKNRRPSKLLEPEKIIYSSSPYPNQPGYERGKMVFLEGMKRFELEDLLRASAEMLGKGGFGTAYKAVLDDGSVVAVKRLKEANVVSKREFDQQMELLGRLKHQNLVSLKAYYYAREEKLLVYDFMANGSLFWLLHGNRGPGRSPLDWTTRLKIASGAARGLAFIHSSCNSIKLIHGNIKSTNILIDATGNPRVSDFGLTVFASPTSSVPRLNGYIAPESLDGRKLTQKSDVYSFGVLLLELLTGKCPSVVDTNGPGLSYTGAVDLPRWVQSVVREEWTAEVFDLELMRYKDIEEEMVGLLQIALSCTAVLPDQRPRMGHVVKMIDDIRGVEVSPSHEAGDSVSESPCLSEDTCGASI